MAAAKNLQGFKVKSVLLNPTPGDSLVEDQDAPLALAFSAPKAEQARTQPNTSSPRLTAFTHASVLSESQPLSELTARCRVRNCHSRTTSGSPRRRPCRSSPRRPVCDSSGTRSGAEEVLTQIETWFGESERKEWYFISVKILFAKQVG